MVLLARGSPLLALLHGLENAACAQPRSGPNKCWFPAYERTAPKLRSHPTSTGGTVECMAADKETGMQLVEATDRAVKEAMEVGGVEEGKEVMARDGGGAITSYSATTVPSTGAYA